MRDKQGRFQPGPDESRHQLTTEERQRGFAAALAKVSAMSDTGYTWLQMRVRGWYCWRKRQQAAADQVEPKRRKRQ